jgi:hypothetical protein
LLETRIRVFVAPRNGIDGDGLRAVAGAGLHFSGVGGVRSGWPLLRCRTWTLWYRLRKWRMGGGLGTPWVLDLGDHRELPGVPVTPTSLFEASKAIFETAASVGGVFCLATHYWEGAAASGRTGEPAVCEQLSYFINRARSDASVIWKSVGDVLSADDSVLVPSVLHYGQCYQGHVRSGRL